MALPITQELPHTFQHYLLGLFAVANNVPALGPYLSLSESVSRSQARHVVRVATLTSLLIMLGAYWCGTTVLTFFGIGVSAFQIAGGLLLGSGGLSMLHADDPTGAREKQIDTSRIDAIQLTSTAIVPISLPLTTGAGTMSTITVYAEAARSLQHRLELLAAIGAMTAIIALMFAFASQLTRWLGHVGMTVLIKVMGVFTLAIGIQFVVTGVSTIVEGLPLRLAAG
ncbi:MAG: MarC family protein [Cyanobacteriota bacterium]|nr:MarC family protein [Cyanobacteriota bacterium]